MAKDESKAWEDLTVAEKLDALGYEGGQNDENVGLALDAFSDTLNVLEEIEELVKSAVADPSEAASVIAAVSKLLAE